MSAMFPVLGDLLLWPDCPRSVPWAAVQAHEAQAERNHGGQSVARLAQRGGLDPIELWAVLNDQPYPRHVPEAHNEVMAEAVAGLAAMFGPPLALMSLLEEGKSHTEPAP